MLTNVWIFKTWIFLKLNKNLRGRIVIFLIFSGTELIYFFLYLGRNWYKKRLLERDLYNMQPSFLTVPSKGLNNGLKLPQNVWRPNAFVVLFGISFKRLHRKNYQVSKLKHINLLCIKYKYIIHFTDHTGWPFSFIIVWT